MNARLVIRSTTGRVVAAALGALPAVGHLGCMPTSGERSENTDPLTGETTQSASLTWPLRAASDRPGSTPNPTELHPDPSASEDRATNGDR